MYTAVEDTDISFVPNSLAYVALILVRVSKTFIPGCFSCCVVYLHYKAIT